MHELGVVFHIIDELKVVAEEKGKMVKYREMLDKVLVQLDNVRKKAGK